MDTVVVKKYNDVYIRVFSDAGIEQELKEHFTFMVPNAKWHPKVRARIWDGKIRLYNIANKTLYSGLLHYVEKFCKERDYELIIEDDLDQQKEMSLVEAKSFYDSLKLPNGIEERDYQLETFAHCIRNSRALFVSPTSSGKSLMIYALVRYYRKKTLIIVDSINLLNQMFSDFQEYGFDSEKYVHRISSGAEKNSDKPIIITTWQSAVKQKKEWFDQFGLVIGDEAHKYKATSFVKIMENLTDCPYRFGFTGTLDGLQTNQMVLEGLFGTYKQIITTKELIDRNFISPVKIKCIILKYADSIRKQMAKRKDYKPTYEGELKFLLGNERRNKFIKNLALSLEGNVLILFQRVDTHGVPIYNDLKQLARNPVYFVSGKVDGEEREEIRKIVNKTESSIIVASYGTFSTGVNIPRIHHIILASPTKSQIRLLQSIGRGLRKADDKDVCIIYDIADDLTWKSWINFTLKHFSERVKIYIKEQFPYKIYKVEIKE